MKTTFTLIALCSMLWATAQFNGNRETRYDMMLETVEYELPINGTPYIDEIFRKGTITIENPEGVLTEERLMRFNAFTGDIEYLNANTNRTQTLLKRENIWVSLNDRIYEVHPYREGGEIYRSFFMPMTAGKAVLYKKPVKHFRKGQNPEHGYEVTKNPEYFDASSYYLSFDGDAMIPVKLNRRSLLKALEDQRADLQDYIAQENLKLRDERDAAKLVRYYNTLQAIN